MIDRSDRYWYRDAVIYQLHVKSFFDANDDGVGDLVGLVAKLDYIKDLGATAIWLMPFYPSPLKDDGYDIADYRGINPTYGSMRDIRRLIAEAHARGLRLITELVINHTSDRHPWFQRARNARPGTSARDFYVWSETDQPYADARIIFLDTEASNWTWDPVAQAYFWHRFYSHQPDLNFKNPRVLEAILSVMRFWLDLGIDGLRLDAIPYLCEREGTNCENLEETHEVIRTIREALDARYPDRLLLAEANQWPEETASYFGSGDECHMAFHFPLMARMYMSLALEDRHPVTDILRQTPEIPPNTQWAIFLRNHDELTLEMVTDRERDYLWKFYATDKRARINLGIRRRLAPLLENDRRKIELMNFLLFSMPGTPVVYYGDEIGMGDNIYLGDRDGVRTPMQWSPDRNGGFSRVDPARLFLPTVQDPIYGFGSVNVEAQLSTPHSLLYWMRRMIAIRLRHKALGRGALRFLYPANRKVLAYIRELDDDRILCVANFSRAPQAVELDLSDETGKTLVELTSGVGFPPIGALPYLLTLPGYGFFWFAIDATKSAPDRFGPPPPAELFTLVLRGPASRLLRTREKIAFETRVAPAFLTSRRWYAGKADGRPQISVEDIGALDGGATTYLLTLIGTKTRSPAAQSSYFAPLAVQEGREDEALVPYAVARVRRGGEMGLVVDADADPAFGRVMVAAMRDSLSIVSEEGGAFAFYATEELGHEDPGPCRRIGGEQSNSSIAIGSQSVLKIFRQTKPGLNPEIEMGRFLTKAGFASIARLLGWAQYEKKGDEPRSLCILHKFVENQGTAWAWTLDALKVSFDRLASTGGDQDTAQAFSHLLPYIEILGRRTGELHATLARVSDDSAFSPEPLRSKDLAAVVDDAMRYLAAARAGLQTSLESLRPDLRIDVETFLSRENEVRTLLDDVRKRKPRGTRIRVHGDLHLGQILIAKEDIVFVDFEGEPARPVEERRRKDSPWRDVAGIMRSFAYVLAFALRGMPEQPTPAWYNIKQSAARWLHGAEEMFLENYLANAPTETLGGDEGARTLLPIYTLSKALYEIAYELDNRPEWVGIPVRGVLALLDAKKADPS